MPPKKKAATVVADQPATGRSSRSKTAAALACRTESTATNSGTVAKGVFGCGSRPTTRRNSKEQPLSAATKTTPITPPADNQATTRKKAVKKNGKKPATEFAKTKKGAKSKTTLSHISQPVGAVSPTEEPAQPEIHESPHITSRKNTNSEPANLSQGTCPPINMRKRTREIVENNALNEKETATSPKKIRTAVSVTKKGARKYTPFKIENVEAWFGRYQDGGKDAVMTPAACSRWMADLRISEDSAAFYVLAWRLGATTMFTLTKDEFVGGMKKLGIDSNDKLLDLLPILLDQLSPSFDSLEFKSFYKFCFNYGKSGGPPGSKNVELAVAVEFLKVALDRDRYRINYTLPAAMEENMRGKKTEGDFPHLYAFIEFLITAAKLKVLNRDQWESFLPFNKMVGWGLEGYSEDSAWPSLFDEYAEWRKTNYPLTIVCLQQDENTVQDQ